jgi:nicotinamide riboside kinase
MEGIKSKLVCVIGAPSSGKSTLAASVHHGLKITKRNSIFVGEDEDNFVGVSEIVLNDTFQSRKSKPKNP